MSIVVGLAVLATVLLHFRQWRRSLTPPPAPSSFSLPDYSAVLNASVKPFSPTEKKYLALFLEGKSTEEISAAMQVEPSSVYTMKYRIRKKLPKDYPLPY